MPDWVLAGADEYKRRLKADVKLSMIVIPVACEGGHDRCLFSSRGLCDDGLFVQRRLRYKPRG